MASRRDALLAALVVAVVAVVLALHSCDRVGPDDRLRPSAPRAAPADFAPPRAVERPKARVAAVPAAAVPGTERATSPAEPPPAWVRVRVTCSDRPVETCHFAMADAPQAWLPQRARAAGEYELDLPAELSLPATFHVRAPGWVPVRFDVEARGETVEVRLPRGSRIEGRVRRADGAAVPPSVVWIGRSSAHTDAEGRFVMDEVQPGRFEAAGVTGGGLVRNLVLSEPVVIERAGEIFRVDLTLEDVGRFAVRVVRDSDGTPVAGADVKLCVTDWVRDDMACAVTDADGVAWIADLPPGQYWCWAWGKTIDPVYRERIRIPPAEPVVLRADDREFHRVFGRVVDGAGRPVADVRVSCEYGGPTDGMRTGKDGRFSIDRVFERPWPTRITSGAPWPLRVTILRLPGNAMTTYDVEWDRELELTYTRPARWTGTIQDLSGRRLPRFDLLFRAADGGRYRYHGEKVDESDRRSFTWTHGPALAGELRVALSDGRSKVLQVDARGKESFDLGTVTFEPGGSLRLVTSQLLDRKRSPWVSWRTPGTTESDLYASTGLEERDGAWQTTDVVPPGRWQLVVTQRDCLPADGGVHEVHAGGITEFTASVGRAAELTVIVERDREAVTGATVELETPEWTDVAADLRTRSFMGVTPHQYSGPGIDLRATTDVRGRAWFSRLHPGKVVVVVADPGTGAEVRETFLLREGEPELLTVALPR